MMSLTCSFYCNSTRCRFRFVDQPEFRMIRMVDAAPRRRSSWMVLYWSTEITTHLEKNCHRSPCKGFKGHCSVVGLAHLGTNAGLCDSCHHWCLAQNHHVSTFPFPHSTSGISIPRRQTQFWYLFEGSQMESSSSQGSQGLKMKHACNHPLAISSDILGLSLSFVRSKANNSSSSTMKFIMFWKWIHQMVHSSKDTRSDGLSVLSVPNEANNH